MASGAPWFAKAGMQNPGANALTGSAMGGGSQWNPPAALYAHALPPSRNCGGRVVLVLVQWAYFSARRMVFVAPSGMPVSILVLPCEFVLNGMVVMLFSATTRALDP